MFVPPRPKIYHIIHADRLASVASEGFLWSDSMVRELEIGGTTIGMNRIKQYRLMRLIQCHDNLKVGDCTPFYFSPRSVMLYVIYKRDHSELEYRGGQGPIVHLEADLYEAVAWANENRRRWAFTTSNAASSYFASYCDVEHLDKINWEAVKARQWSGADIDPSIKEGKQAEFLVERSFPWRLISRIGIRSRRVYPKVQNALSGARHRPRVEIKPGWYY